ncbi:MAG: YdeI/OmpD-associated family protein [Flavobacteriales bacterium]|nr:YdeI/OmpD-associated family protein [Flavobacteriales bacterium]
MRNQELDPYFETANAPWQLELLRALREIALGCGLRETKKWGAPVYVNCRNVVSFGAFKHHVSIWFFEGVHLTDHAGVLAAAQEKTKAMRQWRFEEGDPFNPELVREYMTEALYNDEKGLKTAPQRVRDVTVPQELQAALEQSPEAMARFERMPPSHRREHADYVAEAKRTETRERRAQKCIALILIGEGLNDRYR